MEKFVIVLIFSVIFGFFGHVQTSNSGINFSYDPDSLNGPQNWVNTYPECGKMRQSPINIDVNSLNRGVFKTQLHLEGLDTPISNIEVSNQALTGKVALQYENVQPYLSGGPLSSTYLLDSLHFHWGVVDADGSEHSINGQKYPIEGHFVFYNKAYQTPSNALNYPDGYAVVGVLYKAKKSCTRSPVFNMLRNVTEEGNVVRVPAPTLSLRDLIPKNFMYAYYKGSFTTPPCSQIVDWFVSLNEMPIGEEELKDLRQFQDGHSRPISNNFRPIQKSYGRRVLMGIINNE